jgi:hypothetical protein
MVKSDNIQELVVALVKFHSIVGVVKKDAENPFFKNSYAPLPTILKAIDGPLVECGLTLTQFPSGDCGITNILAHTSGQFIMENCEMSTVKNDPQSKGSAISYLRRYSLGAILGLTIDEDDDGNKASNNETSKSVTTSSKTPVVYGSSDNSQEKPWLNKDTIKYKAVVESLKLKTTTIDQVEKHYKLSKLMREELQDILSDNKK